MNGMRGDEGRNANYLFLDVRLKWDTVSMMVVVMGYGKYDGSSNGSYRNRRELPG